MRKARERAIILVMALLIGIISVKPIFAETSATFSASCYMPYYVTMPEGEMVLAESENAGQDTKVAENQEIEKSNIENETNLIQQQEEIISEDSEEIELIKTVCAK